MKKYFGLANFTNKEVIFLAKKYLHHLPPREQLVIIHRYGAVINGMEILPKSFDAIAPLIKNEVTGEYNLSPARVCQLARKAVVKMYYLSIEESK